MKGAVFITFETMVCEQFGLSVWEQLLALCHPESEGIYISVESYKDEELFDFVAKLSELTETDVPILVEHFGHYLFHALNEKYPVFTEQKSDFFNFLNSIDTVIHKEVRKLYNDPNLPSLKCDMVSKDLMVMTYHSPRKLCILAEGLIRGAAEFYKVEYQLSHDICMHKEDEHCQFRIQLNGQ